MATLFTAVGFEIGCGRSPPQTVAKLKPALEAAGVKRTAETAGLDPAL